VDTVAPAPTVAQPASPSKDTTPTFTGTAGFQAADASHADDAATVEVAVFAGTATSGTPVAGPYTVDVQSDHSWSQTSDALSPDGTYTVVVSQADGSSNSGSDHQSFVLDTTPPDAPSITSPADNSYDNTSSLTVSGTAEAGSTVDLFDGATSLGTKTATGG